MKGEKALKKMKGVLAMKGEVFQLFCYFNDNDNKTKGFINLSKKQSTFIITCHDSTIKLHLFRINTHNKIITFNFEK